MDAKELKDMLAEQTAAFEQKLADIKTAKPEEVTELKTQATALETSINEVKTALEELDVKMQGMNETKMPEVKTFETAVQDILDSDEFKDGLANGFRKKGTNEFLINANLFDKKFDLGDITGTVNMTQQNLSVGFAPLNNLAFIPNTRTAFVGQDKNRVLWVEGAYTSKGIVTGKFC